jgi:bifunctional DNA-binding transcriptional regulator/antitoxin component of YhaV-PrlF toxin-antitoxin module
VRKEELPYVHCLDHHESQTMIPRDTRQGSGLKPEDRVIFTLLADGAIVVRDKNRSVSELYGALHRSGQKPVRISDMKAWR